MTTAPTIETVYHICKYNEHPSLVDDYPEYKDREDLNLIVIPYYRSWRLNRIPVHRWTYEKITSGEYPTHAETDDDSWLDANGMPYDYHGWTLYQYLGRDLEAVRAFVNSDNLPIRRILKYLTDVCPFNPRIPAALELAKDNYLMFVRYCK